MIWIDSMFHNIMRHWLCSALFFQNWLFLKQEIHIAAAVCPTFVVVLQLGAREC